MITECPNCRRRFLIMQDLFESDDGFVRCGACMHSFKALDQIIDADQHQQGLLIDPPSTANQTLSPDALIRLAEGAQRAQRESMPTSHQAAHSGNISDTHNRIEPTLAADCDTVTDAADDNDAPQNRIGSQHRAANTHSYFKWLLIICVLLLAAILSISFYLPPPTTTSTSTTERLLHRAYNLACTYLPCSNNVDVYVLRGLSVYSNPDIEGSLIVEAIIANTSNSAVGFPALRLEFSDAGGAPVSSHTLEPDEYLTAGSEPRLLEAYSLSPVSFDVADPGFAAVRYEIKFLSGPQAQR